MSVEMILSPNNIPTLGVFKLNNAASLPVFATEGSACFDLCACLTPETPVKKMSGDDNSEVQISVGQDSSLTINPGDRVLVPTGLVLNVPKGFSVRIHPRSGLSFKHGLTLTNCSGIIDSDYVDALYVILQNTSNKSVTIAHGDRICQGEVIKTEPILISHISERPAQKTDRIGGIGSTGR